MTESTLLVQTQKGITTFTLNRPDKCNALDGDLIQRLLDAFYEAGRDNKTAVILLKGAGKHFCAGADLAWMQHLSKSSFELVRDDARKLASLLYLMYSFPKPIITVVQGSVVGGGLGLVACSDIILAAEDANFCFSEVKLGLVPAVVSPYIISMIGEAAARYYFLTAERFSAPEAERLGLVQKVLDATLLEQAGIQLAATMMHNSPAALAEVKRLIPLVANREISLELSEKTAEIFAKVRVSSEAEQGFQAFIEKRPAPWESSL